MKTRRKTDYEQHLERELDYCRLERDRFRDGRNELWQELCDLKREHDELVRNKSKRAA